MGHASIQITSDTYVHLIRWKCDVGTTSSSTFSDATQAQPKTEERNEEPVSDWCERGDSNPHGFTRQILSSLQKRIQQLALSVIGSYGMPQTLVRQGFPTVSKHLVALG